MRPTLALLVEDEPVIALDLIWRLEHLGCRVLWADNADEALVLCAQHNPDVALINFQQSGKLDGMALARRLRTRFGLWVLFLTGARPEDLAAAADYDAQLPVLHKPFTFSQMIRSIAEWAPHPSGSLLIP
jgi:CheY-like chemotaxis protein